MKTEVLHMTRKFNIIGLSSKNSVLGYDQIRKILGPQIELPEPIIDLEVFYDEVSEYSDGEYWIFSHNQHRVPKKFRKNTIIFALQTVVNRLKDDIKVRNSYLEFPPALILTPTETAANDLREMGLESKCLYRPSSNLLIPEKSPKLSEKPVILWYWKPDHPPITPYIEEIIDVMDSIENVEIWTFPSVEKPIEKENIRALGRIEMTEIAPQVDGLVRITSRLDYGRATFDILSNGRWALYNDMPYEEFSENAGLDVFVGEINRLIEERSDKRVSERHNKFKRHFEYRNMKERWLIQFSKSLEVILEDFDRSEIGFEFSREINTKSIILKNFCSKSDIIVNGVFKPRKDCEEWKIQESIDFEESPFDDDNWIYQLNALRIIDPIMFDGLDSWVDVEYCYNHVKNWIDYNDSIGDFGGFRWHDMATGLRAQKLALLLVILEREYPEQIEMIEKIRISCLQHREKLMDESFISPGNHGVFQIHGLMAVSIALNDEVSEMNFEYCSDRIAEMISSQFYEDGVHVENSPEYHFLMIKVFDQILETGWYNGGVIDDLWMRILEKGCLLVWPDGNIIEVGDSNPAKVSKEFYDGFMENFSRKISENEQYRISNGDLDYISHHSKESGYTIIRSVFGLPNTESSMLFSQSAFKSRAHRHSDDLGFSLYESGPVLVDCGKYAYGKSEGRDLALSTRAHNCLQIDGMDFSRDSKDFYDSCVNQITHFDWGALIRIEREWENLEVTQNRVFAYSPGSFFLIIDVFSSNQVREFKQWFHFHERFDNNFEIGGGSVKFADGNFNFSGEFFSSSGKDINLSNHRGQTDPLIGWRSSGYNQLVEINSVSSILNGNEGFLGALFVFDEEEREIELTDNEDEISLRINCNDDAKKIEFVVPRYS